MEVKNAAYEVWRDIIQSTIHADYIKKKTISKASYITDITDGILMCGPINVCVCINLFVYIYIFIFIYLYLYISLYGFYVFCLSFKSYKRMKSELQCGFFQSPLYMATFKFL